MLEHVLVTLDGSQLAEKALAYAKKLVAPDGQVTLLSVVTMPEAQYYSIYEVPIPVTESKFADAVPELEKGMHDYLTKIALDLRQAGLNVDVLTEVGNPANVIIEKAEQLKVDAVVMSTHGRSGISRWLFGSVTQKVLSAMPCPVFVVPGVKQAVVKADDTAETVAE